jgi:hypothetical protein
MPFLGGCEHLSDTGDPNLICEMDGFTHALQKRIRDQFIICSLNEPQMESLPYS